MESYIDVPNPATIIMPAAIHPYFARSGFIASLLPGSANCAALFLTRAIRCSLEELAGSGCGLSFCGRVIKHSCELTSPRSARSSCCFFTLLCVRSIDEVHHDEQHDHSDHKPDHEFLGARVRRITHSIADRISRITLRVPNLFVS